MVTLFWVYKLRASKTIDEYGNYVKLKKVPGLRSMPFVKSFDMYRIDKVIGPAVSDPENTPSEPPYDIISIMEVTSLEDFEQGISSPEGQAFINEWSPFIEQSAVGTIGRIIEP